MLCGAAHSIGEDMTDPLAFDVIIIGGGAAGMMGALTAGQRGRLVLLIEEANRVGK